MVVGVFNVCGVFGGWRLGVGPEPLARRVVVLWENKQTTNFQKRTLCQHVSSMNGLCVLSIVLFVVALAAIRN